MSYVLLNFDVKLDKFPHASVALRESVAEFDLQGVVQEARTCPVKVTDNAVER